MSLHCFAIRALDPGADQDAFSVFGAAPPDGIERRVSQVIREPPDFPPPWASTWGDDRFGLWAELEVNNVIQRLRWIEPGDFTMGSPDTDEWAYPDEKPAHPVRLTEGFWLADTACTQAFWLAVVGADNPSYFSGEPESPVERVSWDDTLNFLALLRQGWTEGVEAVLPTETQWEYACRAGTRSLFHFGDSVHTGLVNFNGKSSSASTSAMLGEYRERTVPVKSLAPNGWGLYQMHGNVWEWCADGVHEAGRLGRYPGSDADLQGESTSQLQVHRTGAFRVLRGGSWRDPAKGVRSAARITAQQASSGRDAGFRLALMSGGPLLR